MDTIADLTASVEGSEPPPMGWYAPLPDPAVETVVLIPGRGLFISTIAEEWNYTRYFPGYGKFLLLDEKTGAVKWEVRRTKDGLEENSIIALAECLVVLIEGSEETKYCGLDWDTGRTVWQHKVKGQSQAKADREGKVLYVAEQPRPAAKASSKAPKGDLTIVALGAADGKQLWRRVFKGQPLDRAVPSMEFLSGKLILGLEKLTALASADGSLAWENADLGWMRAEAAVIDPTHANLAAFDERGFVVQIEVDGTTAWKIEMGLQILHLSSLEGLVLAELAGPGDLGTIAAIDRGTGTLRWKTKMPGELCSRIASADGDCLLAVKAKARHESRLIRLDLELGLIENERILPQESLDAPPLMLELIAGQLVLAGEHWVGTFPMGEGEASWLYAFRPAQHTRFELYAAQAEAVRKEMARQATKAAARGSGGALDGAQAFNGALIRQNRLALSSLIKNPRASALDLQMNISQGRSLANAQFSLGLISLTLGAYESLWAQWDVDFNRYALMPWNLGLVLNAALPAASCQGGLFVRAVSLPRGGRGILLVEPETGRWAELPIAPSQAEAFDPRLDFLMPMVSEDGSRLFAHGIGYDPGAWKTVKNKAAPKAPDAAYLVPMPALMSIDIARQDFLSPGEYDSRHGVLYLDADGNEAFPARFDTAGPFIGGTARVTRGGRVGIIDRSGAFLVEPMFDRITEAGEGLWILESDGKFGLADAGFNQVIGLEYDGIRPFRDGLARVKLGDLFGYMDAGGKIAIAPRFQDSGDFSEGLAWARENGSIVIIDHTGRVSARTKLLDARVDNRFSDGLLAVVEKNKYGEDTWGYCDSSGTVKIPYKYVDAGAFSSGSAPAAVIKIGMTRGAAPTYGFINAKGAWSVSARYDSIGAFHCGLARADNEYGLVGFVDTAGKEVIPLQYRDARDFAEDGIAMVRAGETWLYIDAKGQTYEERPFPEIKADPEGPFPSPPK